MAAQGARHRRDERRGRLLRRRGAPPRRRARRRRRDAAPLGLPRRGRSRRARPLLRARGPVRRAPHRRRARLPPLHLRPPRALRAHGRRAVRRRLPRRRDAEPVHRVQPRREARASSSRSPTGSARATSRPATTRASCATRRRRAVLADGRRRDEGPELLPLRDAARAGSSASSSRSATAPRARCAPRRSARALPGATKGESQELCFVGAGAARVRALRRGARRRTACAPGAIVDARGARRRARTTACTASPSASARGSASRSASPRSSRASTPRAGTVHLGDEDALARARRASSTDVVLSRTASTLPTRARVRVRYRHEGADAASSVHARAGRARRCSTRRCARSRAARSRCSTTATACSAGAASRGRVTAEERDRACAKAQSALRCGARKTLACLALASRSPRSSRRACSLGQRQPARHRHARRPGLLVGPVRPAPRLLRRRPFDQRALQLRIQHGGDFETFSDGSSSSSTTSGKVRGDRRRTDAPGLSASRSWSRCRWASTRPGVPITARARTRPSCTLSPLSPELRADAERRALRAEAVTLNADGRAIAPTGASPSCCRARERARAGRRRSASRTRAPPCDAVRGVGHRWGMPINFKALFDGDPDEVERGERLITAPFQLFLADPREICPAAGPPAPLPRRAHGQLQLLLRARTACAAVSQLDRASRDPRKSTGHMGLAPRRCAPSLLSLAFDEVALRTTWSPYHSRRKARATRLLQPRNLAPALSRR